MTTVDLKVVALSSPCSGSWDQSAAASQWHCGFGPGTSLWPAPPPPDLPAECPSPAPALSFASAVGEQNSKQLMRMKERKGLGWKGKRTKETKHFFKEINHSRPDSKETKKKTSFSQERQKTKKISAKSSIQPLTTVRFSPQHLQRALLCRWKQWQRSNCVAFAPSTNNVQRSNQSTVMATAQQPRNGANRGPTSATANTVCVCLCERKGLCVSVW